MPTWRVIATSPLFTFICVFLVLSLLRLALLSLVGMVSAVHRAGDRNIPYRRILRDLLGWSFPFVRIHRTRPLYSYASFAFHLGILGAGLFLGNHIDIVRENFNISWFSIAKPILDILTLLTIFTGSYLLLHRIYVANSRKLSQRMDYLLMLIILTIFISGFLAGQSWNPIPYDGLMLSHVIFGAVLLLIIPFTKVAHCVLYPLIRFASEIAWHFPPRAGSEAVSDLYGAEGRQV